MIAPHRCNRKNRTQDGAPSTGNRRRRKIERPFRRGFKTFRRLTVALGTSARHVSRDAVSRMCNHFDKAFYEMCSNRPTEGVTLSPSPKKTPAIAPLIAVTMPALSWLRNLPDFRQDGP